MKHKYAELIKEHKLPELRTWLDLEEELTLRDVRVAFAEKLGSFTEMLHVLVHPEDVIAMGESALFSESEQQGLEQFYNSLVLLSKDALIVDVACTIPEEEALVQRLAREWPQIVSEIKRILKRTKEAYNGRRTVVADTSYLG